MSRDRILKRGFFGVLVPLTLFLLFAGETVHAECDHPWCCTLPGHIRGHYCLDALFWQTFVPDLPGVPDDEGSYCYHVWHYGVLGCDGNYIPGLAPYWLGVVCYGQGECGSGEAWCYVDSWSDHCGGCWCGGGGCFPSGTEIKTGAGESKEIQDLSIGDPVVSYNLDTGEEEPASVEGIYQVEREGYYQIKVRDLETGEIKSLEVTGEHPLYALQQEDLDQESQSLIERVVGVIKGLISAIIDLVR